MTYYIKSAVFSLLIALGMAVGAVGTIIYASYTTLREMD